MQLKSRLAFGRGYCGKGIFIAFRDGQQCYLYPHDELLSKVMALGIIEGTASWVSKGIYHFPTLTDEELRLLHPYSL
ncbi:hypothetical protein [Chromobacterium subtsugae]|uniref:hypothetical protein n=1 Tax=Chromobacterium subtsugae TaxID=251747 RepID=UPI00069A5C6A|nr:hypothetical protein [Chromobacterium subtsugae]